MVRQRSVFTRICKNCGEKFVLERQLCTVKGRGSWWRPSRRQYCGKCATKKPWYLTRKKPTGRPKGSGIKPKIPNTICDQCGNKFYKPEAWKRKSEHHFCGKPCLNAWRSEQMKGTMPPQLAENPPTFEQRLKNRPRGPDHYFWKGGITLRGRKGNYVQVRYVKCPQKFIEMARKDGYVMEHRLVMAQQIGRPLSRKEAVHHINHDPLDNRIENLMLFPSNKAHKQYEAQEKNHSSHSHQPP